MARGAIINTVGRDLRKYQEDIIKQVKDAISNAATELEISAYNDLKAGSSRPDLIEEFKSNGLNFIQISKEITKGGLKAEVGVMGDNDMAAYIEFGTGLSAREILAPYPKWVRDLAWTFKGDFDGTLKGSPYLYNNLMRIWPELIKELDRILKVERKS